MSSKPASNTDVNYVQSLSVCLTDWLADCLTVYLFSAQNNLRTNRSRYQVTDEQQGGVRMTVKDKGKEQGKEKDVKKKRKENYSEEGER